MYGYLVPCGGGHPIALSKTRFKFRARQTSGPTDAAAELTYTDGFWTVQASPDGPVVRINDMVRDAGRLLPSDVLSIGQTRFRINYQLPHTAQTKPATPPPVRAAPVRPVETPALGTLIPCGGGRMIPLRKPRLIVGRDPVCDVVVPHKIVSSRHCELQWHGGHWQAVDLGSHNGTFVDGMRYHAKWLFPGNVIGFSKYRYRLDYVAHGARPPTQDDDVPVLSNRSLMASVGLTPERLDSLTVPKDQDEPERKRWQIDAD